MSRDGYASTDWGIDLGNTGHVEQYDDYDDCREHLQFYTSGSVVRRSVIYGPWETVSEAKDCTDCDL